MLLSRWSLSLTETVVFGSCKPLDKLTDTLVPLIVPRVLEILECIWVEESDHSYEDQFFSVT